MEVKITKKKMKPSLSYFYILYFYLIISRKEILHRSLHSSFQSLRSSFAVQQENRHKNIKNMFKNALIVMSYVVPTAARV